MIRESLIMKIYNNKIIDEYRVYNGVYYDFSIKIFPTILFKINSFINLEKASLLHRDRTIIALPS